MDICVRESRGKEREEGGRRGEKEEIAVMKKQIIDNHFENTPVNFGNKNIPALLPVISVLTLECILKFRISSKSKTHLQGIRACLMFSFLHISSYRTFLKSNLEALSKNK